MEKIIDPVDVQLLKAELTPEKKICDTNKGGNEVYVVDAFDAPNVMREIGRLREISFREAGGSSGLSMDIDEFDTRENPYKQIVIWDPDAEAILGGYRYKLGSEVTFKEDGQPDIYNSHMFRFNQIFIDDYLPYTVELGRSFVAPDYQSSKAGAKAIYALDNLWDGIGSVMMQHPKMMYMFGNMTMYQSYDRAARDLINRFLWKHFPDNEELARPKEPAQYESDPRLLDMIICEDDFKQDYRLLKAAIRKLGVSIPPLVNSYMNTSPTLKMFGTGLDHSLGGSEGTGILVGFHEMYADKRDRHKEPYLKHLAAKISRRFPNVTQEILEKLSAIKEARKLKVVKAIEKKRKDKKA